MASQGPNSPGTTSSVAFGTGAWTNPNNAQASDNVYATATPDTHYLRSTNYGFSIPAGATIVGVVCEVEGKVSTGADGLRMILVKGGSEAGGIRQNNNVGTTEQYWSEGSSSDLWSNTLTASDVNSSTFGFSSTFPSSAPTHTASIDHMRMTVYYTPPGAAGQSTIVRQAVNRASTY